MTVEFLGVEAARARDDIAWPDVYYAPGYGAVCEVSDGGRWEVAVGAGGRILFPYLLRPVAPELCDGTTLFDAASPYGIAGTWVDPDVPRSEVVAFRRALREAQARRGVVAEFQRLGGLVPGREALRDALAEVDPSAEVAPFSETIELALADGYDAYWTGAVGRHRTSVRKARKTGYRWTEGPATAEDLAPGSAFRALYEGTMRAVEARPYYLFEDRYYSLLGEALGDDLRLARVLDPDGRYMAAALFMKWGDRLHYHLAGSDRMGARAGANNLLLDGMIAWACERGVVSLHLGGGVKPGDSLFKFKAQFGGRRVAFWLLKAIHDPTRYASLVARRAAQTGRPASELAASGYFPAYRA